MKMYLPFGDYSGEGHKQWDKVLIEAPSMEHLLEAQKKIKAKYGENFFEGFATEWEEPTLTGKIWNALIVEGYPISKLIEKDDVNDWSGLEWYEFALKYLPTNPFVSIEFVIDAFIWLLNKFGAEIICLDETEDIPMICNWTCQGFKTVGYGCF